MKGDERQKRTEWHRIQAWAQFAEDAAGFKKGAHVRVKGELRSREYETDAGTQVRTYVIVASSILNLRPGQRISVSETEPEQAAPARTKPLHRRARGRYTTALFPAPNTPNRSFRILRREQQQRRIALDMTLGHGHIENGLHVPTQMIDDRERKPVFRLAVEKVLQFAAPEAG